MTKNIRSILLCVLFALMGFLGTACSSNEAAIDRAVQQTIEAQQTSQDSSGQSVPNANSPTQDVNIEPTEPVSMPIDSATNEQVSPTPEETAVTTPAIADSDSQRILFTVSEEGAYNLFSIKPNGDDLQKITNFDTPNLIVVSPDLSHIAFTHNQSGFGGASGIYVAPLSNINDVNLEPVRGSEGILVTSEFVWSPDNSQIAIVGLRLVNVDTQASEYGLFVIDTEADEINFLIEYEWGGYPDLDIAWSADGEQLAFVYRNTLFIINSDGSSLTEILSDPNSSHIHSLVWSSDGTKITFNQIIDGTHYIKTIDINSGLVTDHPDNEVADKRGVWSPDGTKLVFTDRKDDPNGDYDVNIELYVINADGSGLLQFTEYEPNTVFDFCPIWSPDSKQLVFKSRYLITPDFVEYTDALIVSDGSNRIVLMKDSEDMRVDCPFAWTP